MDPIQKNHQAYQIELFLGNLLRYGVLLCAAIIGLGILLSFIFPESLHPPLAEFLNHLSRGEMVAPPQFVGCWVESGISCFSNPNMIIGIGLALLIALPIIRVAVTLVLFVAQKDKIFILITSTVLLILLTSLILGREL